MWEKHGEGRKNFPNSIGKAIYHGNLESSFNAKAVVSINHLLQVVDTGELTTTLTETVNIIISIGELL